MECLPPECGTLRAIPKFFANSPQYQPFRKLMAYFTKEFTRFFKELEENNHKEWFHANKKRYEAEVKKPFYRLIEDVVKRAQKIDPAINTISKDRKSVV